LDIKEERKLDDDMIKEINALIDSVKKSVKDDKFEIGLI
jgi:hypothetical protein